MHGTTDASEATDARIDRALVASALDRIRTLELDQRAAEYERLHDELARQLDLDARPRALGE